MRRNSVLYRRCPSEKQEYGTYAAALDAAEMMMARGWVHAGCHIQPYTCTVCGAWHVANRRVRFRDDPDVV